MQVAANGRDIRRQSYAQGKRLLHELESGAFVFGEGENATVVSSMKEVADFSIEVQEKVLEWLKDGGHERGVREKQEKDLVTDAGFVSGKLEAAILAKGGTALAGQILALLNGKQPDGAIVLPNSPKVFRASKERAEVILPDDDDEKDLYSEETRAFLRSREVKAQAVQPAIEPKPEPSQKPAEQSEVMLALQGIAEQMGSIAKRVEQLETAKPAAYPKPKPKPKPKAKKPIPKPPVQT